MKLQGQSVLVTGGASGIGEAVCRRFDAEGANVAVVDIRPDAAEAVAASLQNEALALEVDVRDSAAVERAVEATVERFGKLDVLVNSAGIAGGDEAVRAGERLAQRAREAASGSVQTQMDATIGVSDEQLRLMVETHVYGAFYFIRAVLRPMIAQGSGAIVVIGSRCGQEGCMMLPHYSAAKGAQHALVRAVAQEVAEYGVRVNAVAPGFIDTPINDFLPQDAKDAAVAAIPQGRMGTADEVAAVALFLASDDSSYMLGQVLGPNGALNTSPV